MIARAVFVCAAVLFLLANGASAARYQKTKDGKTLVWNGLRGVAQEVTWSGLRDLNGYATGEGTLTWLRLDSVVNRYTGKMVRGKFEGPVIREQGNTRLQANFANGEKVGGWLEPGSTATASPSPTPNEEPETAETPPTESPPPSPSPVPSPTPTATSTPMPTPSPTPTPTPTPIPSPILSPTPTPRLLPSPTPTPKVSPTPISTPRLIATPSPMPTSRLSPFPTPRLTPISSPVSRGPTVETPVPSLELASPPPQLKTEELPRQELPPLPKTSPSASVSAPERGRKIDPNVKRQIIADFKNKIDFVFGQVEDATDNFHEVDRLEQVKSLPPAVSSHVTLLANQARLFQAQLGHEVTFFECLAEIQTVDSLVAVDEATRDIAAKDAPTARKTLSIIRTRYSEPTAGSPKEVWRYLISLYSLCERLKGEAEQHLERAHSLESQGKKAEALKEYREISRIYPNAVTVEKIRQLESQSP